MSTNINTLYPDREEIEAVMVAPDNGDTPTETNSAESLWDAVEAHDISAVWVVPTYVVADFVHGAARAVLDTASVYDAKDENYSRTGHAVDFHSGKSGWELAALDPNSSKDLEPQCRDFVLMNWPRVSAALELLDPDDGAYRLGELYVLSRQGQGTGLWDAGLGPVGQSLHEAAQVYGNVQGQYEVSDSEVTLVES